MFVASTRSDNWLRSLIRNDFWMFPSRKNAPKESSVRLPRVPISPGLGFTNTLTTDVPSCNAMAPGVLAGTFMASELSVQNAVSDEATVLVSKHCGSRWVTYLSPKYVPVVPPGPSHLAWPFGISHNGLATT